jgi:hypothetical protein
MEDVFSLMSCMKGNDAYIYMEGQGSDFLASKEDKLFFHCGGRRTTLLASDSDSVSYLASSIHHALDRGRVVLSWDLKELISRVLKTTGILMDFHSSIYDLRILSSYFSLGFQRPVKFREAVEFLKKSISEPRWQAFSSLYLSVYVPLMSRVIPEIENCCLVDNEKGICVYPHYVLEGQSNGRMKAIVASESNYNPHSMNLLTKSNLRPPSYDEHFVFFDFRNMEVNTLQWLSGDDCLKTAVDSECDTYKSIWSMITGEDANDAHRGLCKDIFLPVVFGQGASSLASKFGIKEKNAARLIDRMAKTFPVAFDWVKSQSADGNNVATDFFGRRRIFSSRHLYKIRNFSIQSPASMICLKKLVKLRDSLNGRARICFHVHDGYCLLCDKNDVDYVCKTGKKVLEEEEDIFPGLHLRTSCHFGKRLDQLEPK